MPGLLPDTELAPVVRTDFSDDGAWTAFKAQVVEGGAAFRGRHSAPSAAVDFLEDRSFEGLCPEALLAGVGDAFEHDYFFVFDAVASAGAGHPVLVVSTDPQTGVGPFRSDAVQVHAVDTTLAIGRAGYRDFAGAVGLDGVFHGFRHLVA